MVNSQRVRCANYQTTISQLQMDPLFLFPIMLGLGLCKLHFFFASRFPVCQVLTQGTQDGNWKARWGGGRGADDFPLLFLVTTVNAVSAQDLVAAVDSYSLQHFVLFIQHSQNQSHRAPQKE